MASAVRMHASNPQWPFSEEQMAAFMTELKEANKRKAPSVPVIASEE